VWDEKRPLSMVWSGRYLPLKKPPRVRCRFMWGRTREGIVRHDLDSEATTHGDKFRFDSTVNSVIDRWHQIRTIGG
jgi:hypothetical protein